MFIHIKGAYNNNPVNKATINAAANPCFVYKGGGGDEVTSLLFG